MVGLPITLFLCIALDSLIGSAARTLAALATTVCWSPSGAAAGTTAVAPRGG